MPDKFKLVDNTQEGLEEMDKDMEDALKEMYPDLDAEEQEALEEMNPDLEEELLEDVVARYLKDLE